MVKKAKTFLFGTIKRSLYKLGLTNNYNPPVGQVSLGDLNRVTPLCNNFGFNRGGAIDRYYIENFLKEKAAYIKGDVLEIGDNYYTMLFGGKNVLKSDILHVDEKNEAATIIGDISNAPHIADHSFDCIILTQTLHLIYDFKEALKTCYRILKPGGSLLLTVPGITPIDHGEWNSTWYWSFTDMAMDRLATETFPSSNSKVEYFGNVLVASSFLYGLGLPELKKEQLDVKDPFYQVIITVHSIKNL